MNSPDLFDKRGFLRLKDYVDNIKQTQRWKLRVGVGDRLHFILLRLVSEYSWFSSNLYILHNSIVSPFYSLLLNRLQKKHFFDIFMEKKLRIRDYSSYYLEKKIQINTRSYYMSGQGVSQNKETALSIAIGELLERTITGLYDTNQNIMLSSYANLAKKGCSVFYPPIHHQYLKVQKEKYAELNSNPNEKISWVTGKNLITMDETYIPRSLTSWFNENRSKNKILIHATTNGSAGYFNKKGAILRGLLEVVQRDGFLVHWLTQIPPPVINKNSLPKNIQEKINFYFESYGLDLHILNISSLSIPSVLIAAISNNSDVPQVVVSAASSLNFEEAILSALDEMVLASEMFYFFEEKGRADSMLTNKNKFEPFVSNYGKVERQFFWRGKDKVDLFQWFISGDKVSFDGLENITYSNNEDERLLKCLNILKGYGKEYYPVMYQPKNSIQEELGFYVVQIFIPRTFPFYLTESRAPFLSERLNDFTKSKKITKWILNPLPHMFS